jgi:GntR family transcriptional regulator of vanillate catabolism
VTTIQPLNRAKTLKEQAYEQLKTLVLNRTLAPGQVVTELSLSEALGISRTPVRQALSRLASEGLIISNDGRLQVPQITRADAYNVAELRLALEGHTVRRLAERGMTPAALAHLHAVMDEMDALLDDRGQGRDIPEFMRLNREFHMELAVQTGNALLIEETAHVLDLVVLSGLSVLVLQGRAREVINEHRAIVRAITAGDVPAAHQAISDHVLAPQSFAHLPVEPSDPVSPVTTNLLGPELDEALTLKGVPR